ncbi:MULTISPECIES: type II toxin-antitoxin system antitoxin HipB [Vibrionaceae]|jgi:HTH-type transcriptional regulator/antitoxin HipB|uniref:DNA-binding transcriptional regulator n=2 Tax=Vibrio TaxID=662 RepID=A0A2N8ZEV9_9VIBR|nr:MULTISPECIES: type II toxin-antitoxin system antitoxin HipB [Vibrio]MDR9830016.1 type II toxin-antitoxin system antitoxin HipB [Vibrio sp. FNV 38]MDN3680090.1 type II toxin-antitoxin system antitoxin HipB [Vibrio tapetis subsp. quintayensis]OCH65128.1 transcriptional regulator [Vibrio splendidus]OEF04899.1 transcriptional regulator [Vibrio genomosp. F10 str. 9ZB36]PMH30923.1 transcriptional regulator [Vibrio sp. 10N.286.49.C2]
MIYSPKQLADMMLLIRQKNGWTQSELAKRVGIKQATISNFENSPDKTTLSTFFKLIQAMELTLSIQEKAQVSSQDSQDDENW